MGDDRTVELANKWLDVSYLVREEEAKEIEVCGIRYVREGRAPEGAVPDPAMIRALATWLDKEGFRGIHSGPIGEKLRAIADWLEEDVRTPNDREEATEHE